MPTGYSQQVQASWLQECIPAPQLPSGHAVPDGSFAVASEGGQLGELFALDSLFDLPLYNNMEPLAAAPATPSYADAYPLQLHSREYAPDEPTGQAGPCSYGVPQDNVFGQRAQPIVDPAGALCFPAPAQQLPPSRPAPCSWDALATLQTARAAPPQTSNTLLPDIHTLLDDPLTATLIASQMSKPRRRNNRPSEPPLPSMQPAAVIGPSPAPISKPKRKKLRPNDTINTLQQRLEEIASQVQHLTLRNDRLQRKRQVLAFFVQELGNIQVTANEIHIGKQRHEADPSQPPQGAAAYQYWTPQQFLEAFHDLVKMAGRWIMRVEASASDTPSPTDVTEMEEALDELLQVSLCTSYGRMDFMARAMAVQLQLFPRTLSEEAHWSDVVASMELTEQQMEDLLVAHEVYWQYLDNVDREHQAKIQQRVQQASSGDADLSPEQDQVIKMAAFMKKIHNLTLILTMYWFKHILTPLQAARTLVNAYPLIPGGRLLSNTLYALVCSSRGQPSCKPLLGAQPGATATIRAAAGAMPSPAGGS